MALIQRVIDWFAIDLSNLTEDWDLNDADV